MFLHQDITQNGALKTLLLEILRCVKKRMCKAEFVQKDVQKAQNDKSRNWQIQHIVANIRLFLLMHVSY